MTFTAEETAALTAMVKNFKCQVCGNNHIDFNLSPVYRPLYEAANDVVSQWVRLATGHCSWCGMTIEFNMDKLMASYALTKH